ncbi:MAG: DUF177 domain-containing protein [Caldilineaceae bacterium]|nr:DUF177 domain-containing protein [Caldilineaceae bacterium]
MLFNAAWLLAQSTGATRDWHLDEDIAGHWPDLTPAAHLIGYMRLTRIHCGILATGRLETILKLDCSRCLEPVEHPVAVELEEVFRPLKDVETGHYLHPEDYTGPEESVFDEALLINERHELDLREVVRQHLWIGALQYPVCTIEDPEDCEFFRESRLDLARANRDGTESEAIEPVDPRWSALLPLLNPEPNRDADR